jgi:putative PIN family toxin of toxin-antitoxin system
VKRLALGQQWAGFGPDRVRVGQQDLLHIERYAIYDAMKLVVDTNVLVAGLRSRTGASNPLLVAGFRRQFVWCCSVPLFYEYEDVLGRAEFLLDAGLSRKQASEFLEDISATVVPVGIDFQWRPQLNDADDEMVLETAINCGASIVSHNVRDFGDAPARFGLSLLSPAEALRRIRT